jgi:hypothetical protein
MVVLQRSAGHVPLLPVSGEATGQQQMQFEGQYGEIHDTALLQVRQVSDALKGPATKKSTPWSRALLDKSAAFYELRKFITLFNSQPLVLILSMMN